MALRDGFGGWGRRQAVPLAALVALAVLATLSVLIGLTNAQLHSQDFQWSPARILLEGDNPYRVFLDGNPHGRLLLAQQPNYAQLLYVLLLPLAALPFDVAKIGWGVINIALALASCLLTGCYMKLTARQTLLLTLLLASSTPFRNCLGNGQHSLLIYVSFITSLLVLDSRHQAVRRWLGPMALGLTYMKYSFAPSLAMGLLLRRGWRPLLLSFLPVLAGAVAMGVALREPSLPAFLTQPLAVTDTGTATGAFDLLALLRQLLGTSPTVLRTAQAISLLLAGAAPLLGRRLDDKRYWCFVAVGSLSFVTHLLYDYVFLLLPLAYAFTPAARQQRWAIAVCVSFSWFVLRILLAFDLPPLIGSLVGLGCNLVLLALLIRPSPPVAGSAIPPATTQDLAGYSLPPDWSPGAPRGCQVLWVLLGQPLLGSELPGSGWRKALLRRFGARIGSGGRLKPRLRVKFPWRLQVGEHCWLGEAVWIDNLAPVSIGDRVCVSQGAYLCTGNHDFRSPGFDLRLGAISIGSEAWIAARAVLGPGTQVQERAVVGLGAVASGTVAAGSVVRGNPAVEVAQR
jgi:putative colanic acid biosynthesis acetyltransferase WcaF